MRSVAQEGVLTNLAQVQALGMKEGTAGLPVHLHATITYLDPDWRMIFVQDAVGAAFVECSAPGRDVSWTLRPGQMIDVQGVTTNGVLQRNIAVRTLQADGPVALPPPYSVEAEEDFRDAKDAILAKSSGVIIGIRKQANRMDALVRLDRTRTMRWLIPRGNPADPQTLVGSIAEATGVFGLDLDANMRPTGKHVLWINDGSDLEKKGALPTTPIIDLKASPAGEPAPLVRLSGNIVSQAPGEYFYLRDDTGTIRVNYSETAPLGIGSQVEVFGWIGLRRRALVCQDAAVVALSSVPTTSAAAAPSVPTPARADTNLPVLTRIAQIRNLPTAEAARGYPIRITAVVTFNDPSNSVEFAQDASGGIFVDVKAATMTGFPRAQERVEITGFSGPGDFAPVVQAETWRDLGPSVLPKAKATSMRIMLTGAEDSQWVSLSGVIRSQTIEKDNAIFRLATGDSLVDVIVPNAGHRAPARNYVDSWIEAEGVCGTVFDSKRRFQGIKLYVPTWEQLGAHEENAFDPFTRSLRSISDLLEFQPGADGLHRSHLRGIVLLRKSDGSFYLQDSTGAILIESQTSAALVKAGREVEVVGFPAIVNHWPTVQDAVVRSGSTAAETRALRLIPDNPFNPAWEGRLVNLQARVIGHFSSASEESLTVQFGPAMTDALLEKEQPMEELGGIEPGTIVDLTGVYAARLDDKQNLQSFQLLLRAPADVHVVSRPSWWTARRAFLLFAALATVLAFALAWVTALRKQVQDRTRELRGEIEERKRMQAEVTRTHEELVAASRSAGKAEVATSVLHNVGNVLNSVNISANLVVEATKHSNLSNLSKISCLFQEHANDLPAFLTQDPRGRQVPKYLELLVERRETEQKTVLAELESLTKNINHINDIVAMQQSYAKSIGCTEKLHVTALIEDALQMNASELARYDVAVAREFEPGLPEITVDKYKALQILVNLVSNAKHACQESSRSDKRVIARVARDGEDIRISIIDNGVGIPPENLTRIFGFGFTTRKHGHGFGLHSGAISAKELDGSLIARSDGPGLGAEFILQLPVRPESQSAGGDPAKSVPQVPIRKDEADISAAA